MHFTLLPCFLLPPCHSPTFDSPTLISASSKHRNSSLCSFLLHSQVQIQKSGILSSDRALKNMQVLRIVFGPIRSESYYIPIFFHLKGKHAGISGIQYDCFLYLFLVILKYNKIQPHHQVNFTAELQGLIQQCDAVLPSLSNEFWYQPHDIYIPHMGTTYPAQCLEVKK